MIRAEAHTDDYVFKAHFNAEPWFEQASFEEIQALQACGWGGDYASDEVAIYAADYDGGVNTIFEYLRLHPKMGDTKDPVGFECTIEEDEALDWIRRHRPDWYMHLTIPEE